MSHCLTPFLKTLIKGALPGLRQFLAADKKCFLFPHGGGWGKGGEGGGQKGPISKICHTYSTMIKLGTVIPYLKKSNKYMNHMTHPLSSADISIFSPEISKFCHIKKHRHAVDCIFDI